MSYPSAARAAAISPFYVMEIVKQANALAAQGKDIIHLSIGEPDFTATPEVVSALNAAASKGESGYTPALGIMPLREKIAAHYQSAYGLSVSPERIAVTAGASGAMLLALAATLDAGKEVLLADPAYPCNRHFVSNAGGIARLLPCGASQNFQPTAAQIQTAWGAKTAGVLLATPANPTGTSIAQRELEKIYSVCAAHNGFLMVDEIYGLLRYNAAPQTALSISDEIISINSFSKYFNMTGWRLGWLVLPPRLVSTVEKLAQNLFICPSSLAQRAALSCFEPESLAQYESRRQAFQARRDYLIPALQSLGLKIPATPDGAFYIYADVSELPAANGLNQSFSFAQQALTQAGVCVVPAMDFGNAEAAKYIRLSYATSIEQLREAVRRLSVLIQS